MYSTQEINQKRDRRGMHKTSFRFISFILVCIFVSVLASAAGDVAYIVKTSLGVDPNMAS